jgi:DNA repair exonuclease SbcCD nuclease subunit
LGHYHEHQALGPHWWYIGAPLQHTWGDKGQWRGFLVYDTDTRTIERIPLKAPKFVEIIDWNTVTEEMVEDNYVRLVTAKAMSDDDREAWRVKLKARSFEVIPPKVQKSIVNVRASHIALEPNMTMNEVLREFIDSGIADINGLDDNYLLQLGAELLAEAEEN